MITTTSTVNKAVKEYLAKKGVSGWPLFVCSARVCLPQNPYWVQMAFDILSLGVCSCSIVSALVVSL